MVRAAAHLGERQAVAQATQGQPLRRGVSHHVEK